MKILLDTHVFLWVVVHEKLSTSATAAFLDSNNELYLSAASYWEICIKTSIGKLSLAPNWIDLFDQVLSANNIHWLPINKAHCQRVTTLAHLHGDPFDRIIIAQSIVEGMTIMTTDDKIRLYPVTTVW